MDEALEKVKTAMRRAGVHEKLDAEIVDLINACMVDLSIAGVNGTKAILTDPMIRLAFITFCKMHDGEPDEFDRLKRTYDEIKAQLSMSTGYTTWSEANG
jgi:hypothetical protein